MKLNPTIIITSVLFLFTSCHPNDAYIHYIQENLQKELPEFTEKYDSIFIIPRSGCNSCINKADAIILPRLRNKRNLYIFTNIPSKKMLRIQFGSRQLEQENVIVDTDKLYWRQQYKESAYPTLLLVNPDKTLKFNFLLDKF